MLFWISIGVGVLTAVLLFRLFFSDFPAFMESFYRPNSATAKFAVWIALAVIMGFSAYKTLPRHFPKLARGSDPKATTTTVAKAKASVVQARTNSITLTNSVAAPPLPSEATSHGVKLGDTVQISAIHPPVALRTAVITSLDDTQLTVRASSGSYSILWKDLTGLKAAPSPTKSAAK